MGLLSRIEAADYLGISTDTLDRLRSAGKIIASQVSPRLVKYTATDLDIYIAQCRNPLSSESQPRRTGISSGSPMDGRTALRLAQQIVSRQRMSSRRSA